MIKWLKQLLKDWEQMEHESLRAGIIHCMNPFTGVYTHIDQETYKKYLDDKHKAVRKDTSDS